jgi:hypothetical protein
MGFGDGDLKSSTNLYSTLFPECLCRLESWLEVQHARCSRFFDSSHFFIKCDDAILGGEWGRETASEEGMAHIQSRAFDLLY